MDDRLLQALADSIVPAMRNYVAKAVGDLPARIKDEVLQAVAALPKPLDGKDADLAVIKLMVVEEVARGFPPSDGKSITLDDVRPLIEELLAALPRPLDGKDADLAEVKLFIAEEVAKIPSASDGKSVTVDDVRPVLEELIAALPPAKDGKDVEPAQLRLMVAEEVAKIPPASDGKSVTVEDVRPLLEEMVEALPKPKDGVGLAGAVIDRDGELVVTLTDGTHHKLGTVIGKDGDPGRDGLGFDDIDVEHDGERQFKFSFVRGEQVKEFGKFSVPATIYRGVWKDAEYQRGDEVTYAGSQFIAKRDTKGKPEISDDWQLACKRGRDGKDGKPGERGLQGLKGERGEHGPQAYGG